MPRPADASSMMAEMVSISSETGSCRWPLRNRERPARLPPVPHANGKSARPGLAKPGRNPPACGFAHGRESYVVHTNTFRHPKFAKGEDHEPFRQTFVRHLVGRVGRFRSIGPRTGSCSGGVYGPDRRFLLAVVAQRLADRACRAESREGTTTPEHCQVQGTIDGDRPGYGPTPGDATTASLNQTYAIRWLLRLPVSWSRRFYFAGGGGTNGNLGDALGGGALAQGYAVVSQDAGHNNAVNADGRGRHR